MSKRANAYTAAPELIQAATQLHQTIEAMGVDPRLLELVKIRASQINGCAYCLNMHTRDARKLGESEARIYLLSAWHESTLFSAKERAVLAWTEALTQVSSKGAPDADYQALKEHFSEREIVSITSAIAMINFWNRVAIGFASVHPAEREERAAT